GPSIGPLRPFWSLVTGAGRAAEGLRADWQAHLKYTSKNCGFKYVRFHGIFHDDMFVYNEVDGQVVFHFQYIDAVFDAMLDMGVRPFVEFAFCPRPLATKHDTTFWWKGHGSPPSDYSKWGDLIRATMQHWKDRYGIEELSGWYFEVWNEPNLGGGFWSGTRSQYYELYKITVEIVKEFGTSLRVGGPSTSNFVPDSRFDGEIEDLEVQKKLADIDDIDSLEWKPVWVEHFLQWCHSRNVPVDFVSCHPYPTDWALDSSGGQSKRVRQIDATPQDIGLLRRIVDASPFPDAEIHLTEWNSSPSSRDHNHDYVPAAIYVTRTMLASINQVTSLTYWTFTDIFEEEGAGLTPFHGGFGIVNSQGMPKPTFHAFRMLSWLGDEILAQHTDHGIITRNSRTGFLSAILFHYPPEMFTSPPPAYKSRKVAIETVATGIPTRKRIQIGNLKPGAAFIVEELSPGSSGDVVSAWEKIGAPSHITRELTEELRSFASSLASDILVAGDDGSVAIDKSLAAWTLIGLKQVR
ncbi:unnamed protein product, partial [Clonostachys rosea]